MRILLPKTLALLATASLVGCRSSPQTQPEHVAGCPDVLHYESLGLPGFSKTTYDVKDCWITKRLNRSWREQDAVIQARRKPTAAEWKRFDQALQDLRVWEWKGCYTARDLGKELIDGHAWTFSCRIGEHEVHTQGANACASASEPQQTTLDPSSFRRLTEQLERLANPKDAHHSGI